MSYRSLVNTNLARAFRLLKDLAENATITKATDQSFDFGSGNVNSTAVTITFKCVVTSTLSKQSSEATEIMFRTDDVGTLTLGDVVTLNSVSYKVGDTVRSQGPISIVKIHREK